MTMIDGGPGAGYEFGSEKPELIKEKRPQTIELSTYRFACIICAICGGFIGWGLRGFFSN